MTDRHSGQEMLESTSSRPSAQDVRDVMLWTGMKRKLSTHTESGQLRCVEPTYCVEPAYLEVSWNEPSFVAPGLTSKVNGVFKYLTGILDLGPLLKPASES